MRRSERTRRLAALAITAAAWLLVPGAAPARPDLRQGRDAGPLRVFADDGRARRFYYLPGEVVLASSPDGKPLLDFLQIAYSGSSVAGDAGQIIHRNVLSIGVRMEGPSASEIAVARAALGAGAELDAMPIRRLDAAVAYAAVGVKQATPLPGGHFEAPAAESTAGAFWSERNFILTPDDASAQLLWKALQRGQLVLSVSYAFFADAVPPDQPLDDLAGSPELVENVRKAIGGSAASEAEPAREPAPMPLLVKAGSSSIEVNVKKWPDLLRRYEFSGNVPPGYALLDVYCHDFADGLRPDLARRKLEIEAQGVGGRPVRIFTSFDRSAADVTMRSLRFPFAVRLDRPYRYRVTDITEDGVRTTGEWRDAGSWNHILDITTRAALLPAREDASSEGDGGDSL